MASGSSGSSESSEGDEYNIKNLIQSRHRKRVSTDRNPFGSTNPAHGQQDDDDDVASSSGSSSSLNIPTARPKRMRRRVNQEARDQRRSGNMPPANTREQEDDQNGPRPRGSVPFSRGPYHALQLAADRLTDDVQDDIARELESVEQQLEEVGLQMQEAVASGLKDGSFKSRLRSSDVEPPELQPLPLSRKPPAAVSRKRSPSIQKLRDSGSQTPSIGMRNAARIDSHYTALVSQAPRKSDPKSPYPLASRKSGGLNDDRTGVGSSSAMYTEPHKSDYGSTTSTPLSVRVSEARGCQTCRCQSCRVPSGPPQTVQILGKVGNPQSGSGEFVTMEVNNGRIPKSLGLIEICRDFQARVGDYAHTWKEAAVLQQFNLEHSFPESWISSSKEPQLEATSFDMKAELGGNSERFSSLDTETGKWKDSVLGSKFLRKTPRSSYDLEEEHSNHNFSPALYRPDRDMGSESGVSSCSYNPEGVVRPSIHMILDKDVELPGGDGMDYNFSSGVQETVEEGASSQMHRSSSLKEQKMIPESVSSLQTQRKLGRPSEPTEVRSVRSPEVEAVNFEEERSSSSQVKERWRTKSDLNTDREQQSGYASGKWSGLTESNPSDQTTEDYEDCSNSMPEERKVSRKQRREPGGIDGSTEVEVNRVPRSDTRAASIAAHSSYEFVRSNEALSSTRLPLEAFERSNPDVFLDEPRPAARWSLSEVEKKNETRDRHVATSRLCIDIRQEYEPGDDVTHQEVQNQMQEEIAKEFALLGLSTKPRRSKKSNRSKSESDLPTSGDFAHECDNGIRPEITKLAEGSTSVHDYINSEEPTFNASKKLPPDGMSQKDSASRKTVDTRTRGPADRLNNVDDSKRRSKSARRPRFHEEEFVEPSLLVRSAAGPGREVSHRRPTPYPLPLSRQARFRREEFREQLQDFPAEEPAEVRQESDELEWIKKNGESSGTGTSTRKSDAILQILNRKSSRSSGRKSRQTSAEHVVSHIPRDRSTFIQPRSELVDSTSRQNSKAQKEMNANELPGNQDDEPLGSLKHESSQPPLASDITDPLRANLEDQEPPGRHPTMVAQNWNNPQILDETDGSRDRNGQKSSRRSLKTLDSKNSQKYLAKMLSRLSQRISIFQSQGLIETQTPPNSGDLGSQKVTPAESLDPGERHGSRGSSVQAYGTVEPGPRQQFDHIHLRKSQDVSNLLKRRSSDWPFQQDLPIRSKDSVTPSLTEDVSSNVQQITQIPEASTKWSHQISRAGMMSNNLELLALERAGKWDRMRIIYQEQEEWQPGTPHSHRSREAKATREPKRKLPADSKLRPDEAESSREREGEVRSHAHSAFRDTPLRSNRNRTVLTEKWRPTQRPSIHTQTSDEMSSDDVRQGQDGQGGDLPHLDTYSKSEALLPLPSRKAANSETLRKQSIHTQTSDGSSQDETQGTDRQLLPHPPAHQSTSETSSSHQDENWGSQRRQSMQTQTIDGLIVQKEKRPHNRQAQVVPRPSIHLHISSSSEAPFELRTQRADNWGPRRSCQSVQTQTDAENELQHGRGTSGPVSGPPVHRITPDSHRGFQQSSGWEESSWDRSLEKWNPGASKEGQLRLQTGSGVQINQHLIPGALTQHDQLRELPFSQHPYPERTDSVETHAGDLVFRGNPHFNYSSPQQQVEPFYRNGQHDPWFHQSTERESRQYQTGRDFQHVPGQEVPQSHALQNQMQQQSQLQERVPRSNHVSQYNQTMGNVLHERAPRSSQFSQHNQKMGSTGTLQGSTGGTNFRNPQYSLDDGMNNLIAQPSNLNSVDDLHRNERLSYHGVSSGHPNPDFLPQNGNLYDQRLQPETTTSENRSESYNHTRTHPQDVVIRNHQVPQVGRTYTVGGSARGSEFHPAQVPNPSNVERMHSFAMQPGALDTGMQRHSFDTERIYNHTMNPETSENRQLLDVQRMHNSYSVGQPQDMTRGSSDVDRIHSFAMQPQALDDSTDRMQSIDLNRMHSFEVKPQALDDAMTASEIERMHSFAIQPQVLTDAILRASMQSSAGQPSVSDVKGDQLYGQGRTSRKSPQRVPTEQSFPAQPDEMVRPFPEKMGSSAQATVSRSRHTSRNEPTPRSGEQVKSSGSKTGKSVEAKRMHRLSVQPPVRDSGSRSSSQKQVAQKRPSHPSVVQEPQKAAKDLKASQKDRHGVAAATAQKKSSSSEIHRSMDDIPPEVLHLGSKNPKKSSQMQVLNNLLQDLEATVSRSRQNSRDRRKSKMVEHESERRNDSNVNVQGQKGLTHQERSPEETFGDTSSEHVETETLESHDDSTPGTFHQEYFDGERLIPHPGYEVEGEPLHPFEDNDEEVTGSHPVEDDILGQDGDIDGQSYESSVYIPEKHEDELSDITEGSHLPEGHDSIYSDKSTHGSRESVREIMRVAPVNDQRDAYSQRRPQVEARDMMGASNGRSQVEGELRRSSSRSVMKDEPRKSSIRNPPPITPGESKPKSGVKEEFKPSGYTSQMQMDEGSGRSRLKGLMSLPRQDNESHSQPQKHQITNQSEDTESEHATTPQESETLESEGGSVFTATETEGEGHSPYDVENEELTPLETQEGDSPAESEDDGYISRETGDDDDSPESLQPVQRRVAFEGLDEKDHRLTAKTKIVESIVQDFVSGASSSRRTR